MAVLITLLSPALTDTSDESSRSSLRICLLGYSGKILNVGEYVMYLCSVMERFGREVPETRRFGCDPSPENVYQATRTIASFQACGSSIIR